MRLSLRCYKKKKKTRVLHLIDERGSFGIEENAPSRLRSGYVVMIDDDFVRTIVYETDLCGLDTSCGGRTRVSHRTLGGTY